MGITLQSVIMSFALLIATVLTIVIEKLRKENRRDHGYVRERLDGIHENVKEVNNRLEKHIDWHLDATGGPTVELSPKKRAPRRSS
jgi:transcription termination factor NusB